MSPTDDPALKMSGRDKTYVLPSYTDKYTLKLCVTHQQVRGRKIGMLAAAFLYSSGGAPFDESDPGKLSPVCKAVAFSMSVGSNITNTANGEVNFNESSQDLLTPTDWKVTLGFVVAGGTPPTGTPPSNPNVVAHDDTYPIVHGGVLNISAPGVLENDTYPAGAAVTFFGTSGLNFTNHGGDGGFTLDLTGNPASAGIRITIPYEIRSAAGTSNRATVTVNIQ